MTQNVSLPSTEDVVAASGGHPGNPWREQRLLFLYQVASEVEPATAVTPGLQPLPAVA